MYYNDCIVTNRLILRRFVEEDIEDVFDLMSDEYIAEKAGFRPFTSFGMVKQFMQQWKNEAFVITERSSDNVIGIIQTPCLDPHPEVGYWLAKEFRGMGYMTEAIEAVVSYLFENIWWCNEIRLHVFEGNEASCNVALKSGFFPVFESYQENVYSPFGKNESMLTFSITRGDYEWKKLGVNHFSTTPEKGAA